VSGITLHEPAAYRMAVRDALGDGWRFAGLHATDAVVRALLVDGAGHTRLECAPVVTGGMPTIVDLAPAAGWDEREAHDQYGVVFTGHRPLRPFLDHSASLEAWTTPVAGDDVYQVAVGPIHAGVIESGHFRFHLVGDAILHLDVRPMYKHRGLERAAQGLPLDDALAVVGRACAACSVANTVAYAQAVESARGLTASAPVARVRTILLEMERAWNILNDISAVCAGVGLAAGTNRFLALTEDVRRLNALVSGHRFLFGTVSVGGSSLAVNAHTVAQVRDGLARIREESVRAWRQILFNGSFIDRLDGVGIVRTDDARTLGVVGSAARASGVGEDVRTVSPGLAYRGFQPAVLRRCGGDVRARLEQKALELLPCLDVLDELLAGPLVAAQAVADGSGRAIGVGRVESPRGATTCVVEAAGDRVSRLRLRTASYANWPAVAHAAVGNLLPDFPLINKSFELCFACVDR